MLRRHATPNTSNTNTTGTTRLFGFQYWTPSSTPETTVAMKPKTRLNRSRDAPTSRRAGAVIRPIADRPRSAAGASRSSSVFRSRERDESRDAGDPLVLGHAARHAGQHVDRDPVALRLLAHRGRVGPGIVLLSRRLGEEMIHHRGQVPRGD